MVTLVAMNRDRMRREAWIGGAVLELFARGRISRLMQQLTARMTSNQFLPAFGDPTAVEADVGRIFRDRRLQKVFAWHRGESGSRV